MYDNNDETVVATDSEEGDSAEQQQQQQHEREPFDHGAMTKNKNADDSTSSKGSNPANSLASAGFWSRLSFAWAYPVLRVGARRPLVESDLPEISREDQSRYNLRYLKRLWSRECEQNPRAPSLGRALLKDFFRRLWFVQPMMFMGYTARVVQAVVLGYLIESFEGANDRGYLWATVLVLCRAVALCETHHVFFFTWRKGMQYRLACVAAIYDKSLRLSSTHQDTSASYGRIMNLASNDVERFILASLFINQLFWAPAQSVAILVVGCLLVGPAFAAGFGVLLFVLVPLQSYLSTQFALYRSKIAALTDQRITFCSQAVRGARVMKMSGYERRFQDRIQASRKEEITQIRAANTLKAWNEALYFASNVVVSVVIYVVHVVVGGKLTPGLVFTVFTLINILQQEMSKHMALGVMGVSEASVSVKRIQRFLEFPEGGKNISNETDSDLQLSRVDTGDEMTNENSTVMEFRNVSCYWNGLKIPKHKSSSSNSSSSSNNNGGDDNSNDNSSSRQVEEGGGTPSLFCALKGVSVKFGRGQVTAVIGMVGSGKSALLQAVIKELPISSGSIIGRFNDTLSYVSQDPWIMNGTVKENILLGNDLNQKWYDTVIEACGLVPDFEQFLHGDSTIVGDRGVQCSGGQRARIGLARALYRDASVLVADDPLSAVDAKVGRQLFHDAIKGLAVRRGKTVILATHQHQYIGDCKCVLMVQGGVACVGTYQECVAASNGHLMSHQPGDDSLEDPLAVATISSKGLEQIVEEDKTNEAKLVGNDQEEMTKKGLVRVSTYWCYVQAMGGLWVVLFLFILFCATQASVLLTIAWVGNWAEQPSSEQQRDWSVMGLILGMTGAVVVLGTLRALISYQLLIKASQRLHDQMTSAVLRATIAFFDTNPLGRIMNRFSADVGSNDDLLPQTLFDFATMLFMVIGAMITAVVTLPFTLIAIPPLLWSFLWFRNIFVTSSRELKRLEGLARSPIYAMLSESLGGIATIRANNSVAYFQKKFQEVHDAHSRAFFSFIGSSRWVGWRMDFIMFLFLANASFLPVVFHQEGWFEVPPAILGLSLSMLLQLTGIFQWCVRQSSECVNLMVGVERVVAFGKLKPEAPLEVQSDKTLVERGWPANGSIEVEELSVRYRVSLPLTLDKVSFSIPRGARVGVVGRTGSGKSTLVQTLFRLLEAEHGRIVIDGQDIAQVGLHTLRSRLSVIPQIPTLFSGCTVRENLDLFGLHSDEAINKVLEDCHLAHVIAELPQGWDSLVAEGGSNFSVGQRQLLCLARAILSQNKILLLDEATASVDRRTDELLQEALHSSFHDATIIAVAHRLDTIIENDLVVVLGEGHVLEFGPPAELIRAAGHFASMVNDSGEAMSSELRRRAFRKEAEKTE